MFTHLIWLTLFTTCYITFTCHGFQYETSTADPWWWVLNFYEFKDKLRFENVTFSQLLPTHLNSTVST